MVDTKGLLESLCMTDKEYEDSQYVNNDDENFTEMMNLIPKKPYRIKCEDGTYAEPD